MLAIALSFAVSTPAYAQPPRAPSTSRDVSGSSGSDGAPLLWPATPPPEGTLDRPMLLVGHDMPLLTAGIVMLSLGMAMNVIVASLDVSVGNCADFFPPARMECGTAPFALVPLAGGVLLGTVHFHGDHIATAVPIVVGLSSLAPQVFGLVLTLIAVHGHTEDLVSRDVLAVLPWASGEGAGLSLRGAW